MEPFFASIFERESGCLLTILTSVTLLILGFAHINKLGFTLSSFLNSPREYGLLCAAGALFGWLLLDAARAFKEKVFFSPDSARFPRLETITLAATIVFVVLLHQFRYFLNDGPTNIAMGLGLLANFLFGAGVKKHSANVPDDSGGRLYGLYLRSKSEGYSAGLLAELAETHKNLGNVSKASVILSCLEGLKDEDAPK